MIQDQLRQLYELSRLDSGIAQIRQKIAHVPERREEIRSSLQRKERELLEKKEGLGSHEKQKRDLEGDLQLSEERLKEFQAKVNQIKTNREYQATLKEMAETKKINKEVEDRILAHMTEIETLTKASASLEAEYQPEKESSEKELAALEGEEKRIEEEVKGFEEKRRTLQASIEARWLSQYERIKGFRPDAVTSIAEGACQGCHMNIPPQLFIEVQKFRSVHACPSCQRILYLPGGSE